MYNWNKNSSSYHVNLHLQTLEATIKYNKNRDLDTTKLDEERKSLKTFFNIS